MPCPNRSSRVLLPLLLLCVSALPVAGDEAATAASEAGIEYFEKQIRPLLVKHCYQCHSEKAEERGGGLVLDDRQGWLQGGETGPAVVPGDADASLLIRAVRYDDAALQMPPVKPLDAEELARFEHWVRIGAPAPEKIELLGQDDPSDPVAGREHWAFRPLAIPSPPEVTDRDWPLSDIDRFILARLEAAGLQPNPDADPSVLARRLAIQLTGLPPSPELLQEFLSDPKPDAYERLVDRLLASPQFGERFGRHWLDLARYADSNGLDENFLFREAWRYRNWVLAAVNRDLSFDQFVLQQLAGDLLPFESIEQRDQQRIAAGFLTLGPKVLLGNNPNNQKMEVADEQIDSIGRALLGQTLGCARCHNHKFDPVPTADYYALAGIFTSTRVMEQRYMLGEQRVMEQLIGLGPDGATLDDAYEQYWRERPQLGEQKKQAEAALELLKKQDEPALKELAEKQPTAVAELARDVAQTAEARTTSQQALVDQLAKAWNEPPAIPPRAMTATDVETPADEQIRLAGQFDALGETVPRGFLSVLCDAPGEPLSPGQSGRIALAHWLTDARQRSGQLSARVLANRVWHHLLGRGLVRTVDNFGRTGEPPSHPELLDHLAGELVAHDWSLKSLVRQIVLSRTFRLSSQPVAANQEVDPDNTLVWRANRRRLDPESFRDAMLVAANSLDLAPLDSTVGYLGDQATAVGANSVRRRTDFPNRSVYLPVIRNDLPELFEIFDFADPHTTTGMRRSTMVPTQGLYLLNDEVVMDAAKATARRIRDQRPADREATIRLMFDAILNAPPTVAEVRILSQALEQFEQRFASAEPAERELDALTLACHALLASSRFQFLE